MAISETDNRINFPPTLVDFDNVVGITGQPHDNIPAPGQQPRYDWARIYWLGLLANQSSFSPPNGVDGQYRTGTLWFNRNTLSFEVWNGTSWISISNAIQLNSSGNYSLQQFYNDTINNLKAITKKFTFSGITTSFTTTIIPVPTNISSVISADISIYFPLVYINGSLVDPRNCQISGPGTSINLLSGVVLNQNVRFTVIIDHFDVFDANTVFA